MALSSTTHRLPRKPGRSHLCHLLSKAGCKSPFPSSSNYPCPTFPDVQISTQSGIPPGGPPGRRSWLHGGSASPPLLPLAFPILPALGSGKSPRPALTYSPLEGYTRVTRWSFHTSCDRLPQQHCPSYPSLGLSLANPFHL